MQTRIFALCSRHSEEAELAYQLRGGPVFDVFNSDPEEWTFRVLAPDKGGQRARIPSGPEPASVMFVDLILAYDNPRLWEAAIDSGGVIILDVHFPFADELHMRAIQPGRNEKTRDPRKDAEVAAQWMEPKRLERCREIMAQADVITVPRADWTQHVEPYAPFGRVFVLPDVDSPYAGGEYFDALTLAIRTGVKGKYWHLATWWIRVKFGFIERVMGPRIRRRMHDLLVSELEESDVDWEAVK